MKIDILRPPSADIFSRRPMYILFFIGFLLLFCCGLLLIVYATLSETRHYETIEQAVWFFLVVPPVCIAYFGGKLQGYKALYPPQVEELAELCRKHDEIQSYCKQVMSSKREPVRAEYEACVEWAEKKEAQQRTR